MINKFLSKVYYNQKIVKKEINIYKFFRDGEIGYVFTQNALFNVSKAYGIIQNIKSQKIFSPICQT